MGTINEIFNALDDWRYLPSYQLERRADIFFAIHLKEILLKICKTEIDEIIPEFPIRKGSLPEFLKYNNKSSKNYKPNQSFKIDYLAYSKSKNLVYFIELKTEMGSRNKKQDWYLKEAKKLGMNKILEDLKPIQNASNKNGRKKYNYLFEKLVELEWFDGFDEKFKISKAPFNIEIRYIQPIIEDTDDNKELIITFQNIIDKLKDDSNTELTKRFLNSLTNWQPKCN